jgi:lipoprotein-anchoring transpeptidase ErfK/SrfK
MIFRTSGAVAALLLGLAGPSGMALAQYYPPPQAYPPPPPHVYTPYRPLPPVDVDAPMIESRPLPPLGLGPPAIEGPPRTRFGRRAPDYLDAQDLPPLPPAAIYGDVPYGDRPDYRDLPPGYPTTRSHRSPPQPTYIDPPQQGHRETVLPGPRDLPPPGSQGFEPAAAETRPYFPGAPPAAAAVEPVEPEGLRPPMPIGPGQLDAGATGTVRGDSRMAALPPEVRPETGPRKDLPAQFRRTLVDYRTKEPAGTIIIDTPSTYLYFVLGGGKAMRYGIGVGREGFTWTGAEKVSKMAEWPDWNPPSEMIERQPYLPRFMAGGEGNPLGARALYLGKTLYRIHGTNQPSTIGTFVSSGCIRLTNEDVADLYSRVKVGTRVVVLPGGPAMAGPPLVVSPGSAPVTMAPIGPPPSAMAR